MDELIAKLSRLMDNAAANRKNFEAHWTEIAQVLSPAGSLFSEVQVTQGSKNNKKIFDSTGIHSNELLSSGLFSLLTSPTTPWFVMQTTDRELNKKTEVQQWLADITRILHYEIQRPSTRFAAALHEYYLELGSYGNGILFATEKRDLSSLLFQTIPLSEAFFIENDEDSIDALIRRYTRTAAQLIERFGVAKVGEDVMKVQNGSSPNRQIQCLHFILPSDFARIHRLPVKKDMKYVSIYMLPEFKSIVSINFFEEKPFMASRFYKMPQESYGRGPGSIALADLNMLQDIVKTTLRAAQKMVDPPLMSPDTGFLRPPSTNPGRINYYRAGSADRIEPIMTGGRPDIGMDFIEATRVKIREIFFVDQLQLNIGPQMTATEVMQRTEEKQRLMGPVTGRIAAEGLTPLIIRSFGLLSRAGKFPEQPSAMQGQPADLKITYTSPIFKAQERIAATDITRVTQIITPFLSVDPTMMQAFHPQRMIQGICELYNIEPRFLRTEEEMQELQQQQAEQQQADQQSMQLKNAGIGLNNLASASSTFGRM